MELSTGRRRLVIRELELKNFKSYAGSQNVGPFHKASLAVDTTRIRSGGPLKLHRDRAELLLGSRSKRQREVQRHRCHALCLWQTSKAGEHLGGSVV